MYMSYVTYYLVLDISLQTLRAGGEVDFGDQEQSQRELHKAFSDLETIQQSIEQRVHSDVMQECSNKMRDIVVCNMLFQRLCDIDN